MKKITHFLITLALVAASGSAAAQTTISSGSCGATLTYTITANAGDKGFASYGGRLGVDVLVVQ